MVFRFVVLQMRMHSPVWATDVHFLPEVSSGSLLHLRTAKALVGLRLCTGSSEHLLVSYPLGTQCLNDVVSTSMRRDHVASTLIRRHFDVICLLGI